MQSQILKDYISREALAAELGKSVKTLVRWELDGKGPPVTRFGRDVYYRLASLEAWQKAQEIAGHAAVAA